MAQNGFLQMLATLGFGRNRRRYSWVLLIAMGSAQAGLLQDVVDQVGILAVVKPVSSAVGIELDDGLGALDAALSGDLQPLSEEFGSLAVSDELRAMDQGILAADEGGAPVATGVFSSGKDQPALVPLASIDPVFTAGRIQGDHYTCADGDGDGVCDQDDQCLKTPRGIKTLANGCYIDGPQTLRLDGVFFDHASSRLSLTAKSVLAKVVPVILQSSADRIEVGGHTDSQGGDTYNLRLSQARANAVRAYLVSLGVSAERLVAKAYGKSQPLADNNTESGREKNRRVELKRL